MTKIKRPMRFFGSKWSIQKWIWHHFPLHDHFVDLCGGGGNIWYNKPRALAETYNDIDEQLTDFFKTLRENPAELIDLLELTPWSQQEFEQSKTSTNDPLENARRFFVRAFMGIGAHVEHDGFRMVKSITKLNAHIPAKDFQNLGFLSAIAERFKGVQILNHDALDLIDKFMNAGPNVLLFFDPPYLHRTRTSSRYPHDVDDTWHEAAATLLTQTSCSVVVCGYADPLYAEWYEKKDFVRVDIEATTQGKNATESLWLSPQVTSQLSHRMRQVSLFDSGSC